MPSEILGKKEMINIVSFAGCSGERDEGKRITFFSALMCETLFILSVERIQIVLLVGRYTR